MVKVPITRNGATTANSTAETPAATLAPFGTVRTSVVESVETHGRLQLEMRPTQADLPPECDTALVAAGYIAVSAITGVHLDDRVDTDKVLELIAPEPRGPA